MWLVCSFEDTGELRKFKGEGIIWDFYTWLVVWTPLKNMKVKSVGMIIPIIYILYIYIYILYIYIYILWKNKTCSKPPTRIHLGSTLAMCLWQESGIIHRSRGIRPGMSRQVTHGHSPGIPWSQRNPRDQPTNRWFKYNLNPRDIIQDINKMVI